VEGDDNLVDDLLDEVFDEDLVESFAVEAEDFLVDVLLLVVETTLPSTHLHSLARSLAEYLAKGEVVLGLAPGQQYSEILGTWTY
jgi:hypothetical protein